MSLITARNSSPVSLTPVRPSVVGIGKGFLTSINDTAQACLTGVIFTDEVPKIVSNILVIYQTSSNVNNTPFWDRRGTDPRKNSFVKQLETLSL
jgi:hypothetical protein